LLGKTSIETRLSTDELTAHWPSPGILVWSQTGSTPGWWGRIWYDPPPYRLNVVLGSAGTVNPASPGFDGGTLRAGVVESNFISGPNSVGSHSAINILPGGGTIDSNGFDVRIKASDVAANPGDVAIGGLAGTLLNKEGAGTLTLESAVGDGTVDFEVSQTLDTLVLGAGGTVTISSLGAPPAPEGDTSRWLHRLRWVRRL
jgi:hypothetical protein